MKIALCGASTVSKDLITRSLDEILKQLGLGSSTEFFLWHGFAKVAELYFLNRQDTLNWEVMPDANKNQFQQQVVSKLMTTMDLVILWNSDDLTDDEQTSFLHVHNRKQQAIVIDCDDESVETYNMEEPQLEESVGVAIGKGEFDVFAGPGSIYMPPRNLDIRNVQSYIEWLEKQPDLVKRIITACKKKRIASNRDFIASTIAALANGKIVFNEEDNTNYIFEAIETLHKHLTLHFRVENLMLDTHSVEVLAAMSAINIALIEIGSNSKRHLKSAKIPEKLRRERDRSKGMATPAVFELASKIVVAYISITNEKEQIAKFFKKCDLDQLWDTYLEFEKQELPVYNIDKMHKTNKGSYYIERFSERSQS